MTKTRNHFARPLPVDGKTPTHGTHPCRVCGQPVHRSGKQMNTDGVRGSWRHQNGHLLALNPAKAAS